MKALDLTGKRFGRWTIIKFARRANKNGISRRYWLCECDCGNREQIVSTALRSGNSTKCVSCKKLGQATHYMSQSSEYRAWIDMHQRCNNSSHNRYYAYGGRGISICARWDSFDNFIADMKLKPNVELSLDRIDNNGNYEPKNCRWATRSQQQLNKGDKRVSA